MPPTEQEVREAEEAVDKDFAEIGAHSNKSLWEIYKGFAVRRELKLRAYERAVKEIESEERIALHAKDGLKVALSIIRKHLDSL